MNRSARAYWLRSPGHGEIREVTLPEPSEGDVVVRALWSGVSRGDRDAGVPRRCAAQPVRGHARTLVGDDTAAAAREVAELGDPRHAALAPPAAAELSGLEVLRPGVEDDPDNTTRFVVLSREAAPARRRACRR